MSPAEPTSDIVLDTNAVLDWLVFQDAGMAAVGASVEAGRIRWLFCPAMLDECKHVLQRGELGPWRPDAAAVEASWSRLAVECPAPTPTLTWPRCTDPDDQVFIDLAIAQRARWLLTQDRALLKLRRRAPAYGVRILSPAEWPGLRRD